MRPPSSCDECGKKFKVFGKKRKCKHCIDVVCKGCLTTHVEHKHTWQNTNVRRRNSRESANATSTNEQEDLQSQSHHGSSDLKLECTDTQVSGNADGIEAASDDDDDGDLYDDGAEDDAEDDELLMTTRSKQPFIENGKIQHKELCMIQGAVATWAMKEKHAKQEMQRKQYKCTMTLGFSEISDYDNCSSFKSVSYVVTATAVVWISFGLLLAAYLQARSLHAGYSSTLVNAS